MEHPEVTELRFIETRPGVRIAVDVHQPERAQPHHPGFFWLGGFKSEMTGTKATRLRDIARWGSRPFVRFDYSGHGQSEGRFEDGTISHWLDETEAVFSLTRGWPMILIGSSMGGYLALLLVKRLAVQQSPLLADVKGLVLVAPAADMTEALLWRQADDRSRAAIMNEGVWMRPSAYGEPYPITRRLIEDGRRHLLTADGLDIDAPVRILHGDRDLDVPWEHGLKTFRALRGADRQFILIGGGDHRLSRDSDIQAIYRSAEELAIKAIPAPPEEVPAGPHDRLDR
jgi:pimeloyl-ACP methyl ester carboxylesterase